MKTKTLLGCLLAFTLTAGEPSKPATIEVRLVLENASPDSEELRHAEVTRDNIGRRLAIVIDGRVYAAPVVRTEIAGGKAVISGSFSEEQARELAASLKRRPGK